MELWIPITLAAAFLQNLRSSLQKQLQVDLGTRGATYVRFLYGAPIVFAFLVGLTSLQGEPLPQANGEFLALAIVGGTAQALATAALLASFRTRNFAAGVAYSKTEPLQAAMFGLLILGEATSPRALAVIGMGIVAVLILTVGTEALRPRMWLQLVRDRGAAFGLLAGAGFGLAAICYRGAGLALPSGTFLMRALFTLACVISFQTIAMTVEMFLMERATLGRVFRNWRRGSLVGIVAATASAGWFSASILENAAYVRAFGQVELLFAIASSVLLFGESLERREIVGMGLLALSLILLLAT